MQDIIYDGTIITFKDGSTLNIEGIGFTTVNNRDAICISISDPNFNISELKSIFSRTNAISEMSISATIIEDDGTKVPSTTTYFDYSVLLKITDFTSDPNATIRFVVVLGQISNSEKIMAELLNRVDNNQSGLIELAKMMEDK